MLQGVLNMSSCHEVDEQRRQFLLAASCVLGGVGAFCALTPFIASWMPNAKTQAANAPVRVDLSVLQPGQQLTVTWRGKPIWIIRRTADMLQNLANHNTALRDPDSKVNQQPPYAQNNYRSINPEFLVLVGICTHLGCIPVYKPHVHELNPQWPGGFYCPCHGSSFDLAGRVFKGAPAPINLEVPPYYFLDANTLIIGEKAC